MPNTYVYNPLPETAADLVRVTPQKPRVNHEVETLIKGKLYDNAVFKRYLATVNGNAVEGTRGADRHMAALMIRNEARDQDNPVVGPLTLTKIGQAMAVFERKHGLSRTQRRIVQTPAEGGNNGQ